MLISCSHWGLHFALRGGHVEPRRLVGGGIEFIYVSRADMPKDDSIPQWNDDPLTCCKGLSDEKCSAVPRGECLRD